MDAVEILTREVMLERLTVAARASLSRYEITDAVTNSARFEAMLERHLDRLAVQVRAHIYANKLDSKTVTLRVESPRSPWQAIKQRVRDLETIHTVAQLAVAAWTCAFPVKSQVRAETHTFEVFDKYPDQAVHLPEDQWGRPVRVALYTGPAGWSE